ncbi:hypothetical protein [Bacillus cereus]|uniref:hypothetical protein n=1 Tax=Bacillus cereus TaxID=1396 RepID=UPI000BF43B93|nr:hypothetical protein [Bacillus cereus]PFT46219.1 hypothetical protein COK63_05215 [Bacillus cereus]TKH73416.1 hypothetical protein FC676_11425 [Bacillus cereus]
MITFVTIFAYICVTVLFCGGVIAIFNRKKSKYAEKNDDKVSMRAYDVNVNFGMNMMFAGGVAMGFLFVGTIVVCLQGSFIYI